MNIKKLLVVILAGAAISGFARQINPVTQAVLDSYKEILAKDPKDYITLYQQAVQYYNLRMYDDALVSVRKALEYTPEKDSDMRKQEYSVLANILTSVKDNKGALEAVDAALAIAPESYPLLYTKGNICLELKDAEGAAQAFRRLQILNPRSQESLFGQARVAVLRGDRTTAEGLMKEAENLESSNYLTYCRIGDISRELGDNVKAATNYLSGFALANGESRPIQSLVDLARADYKSVESAIDYAITMTPNTIPLNFLKGNIALATGNYQAAYSAFNTLVSIPEGRGAGVYASLAKAALAMDKPKEAIDAINIAVASSPADFRLEKARIERAAGNPSTALEDATKAYNEDLNNTDALVEMALANIDLGQNEAALANLNEAVLTDPSQAEPLMIRGYVYSEKLKNSKNALADYKRVARMEASDFHQSAYKALAQTLAGDKAAGDATMAKAMQSASTPEDYFDAAIYYAQSGNLEEGKRMLDKARSLGFQNIYLLDKDKTANLNIAPLRHL